MTSTTVSIDNIDNIDNIDIDIDNIDVLNIGAHPYRNSRPVRATDL